MTNSPSFGRATRRSKTTQTTVAESMGYMALGNASGDDMSGHHELGTNDDDMNCLLTFLNGESRSTQLQAAQATSQATPSGIAPQAPGIFDHGYNPEWSDAFMIGDLISLDEASAGAQDQGQVFQAARHGDAVDLPERFSELQEDFTSTQGPEDAALFPSGMRQPSVWQHNQPLADMFYFGSGSTPPTQMDDVSYRPHAGNSGHNLRVPESTFAHLQDSSPHVSRSTTSTDQSLSTGSTALPRSTAALVFNPVNQIKRESVARKAVKTTDSKPEDGLTAPAAARKALEILSKGQAKAYFLAIGGAEATPVSSAYQGIGNVFDPPTTFEPSTRSGGFPEQGVTQQMPNDLDTMLQAATNRLVRRGGGIEYYKINPTQDDDFMDISVDLAADMSQALYDSITAEPAKAPKDWSQKDQDSWNKKQQDQLKSVKKIMAFEECEQDHHDLCTQAIGAAIRLHKDGVPYADLDMKRFHAKNPAVITKSSYRIDETLTCIQRVYALMRLIKDNKYVAYDLVHNYQSMDDYLRNPVYALAKKFAQFMNNELRESDRKLGYSLNNPADEVSDVEEDSADEEHDGARPAKKRKRQAKAPKKRAPRMKKAVEEEVADADEQVDL